MAINLFYEGIDSSEGYQSSVLRQIDEKVHFDKCVLTNKNGDGTDIYDPSKYLVLDYDMCAHVKYHKFYDFNDFDALSEEIIMNMKPYEDIAMQLLGREYNFDVFTFGECKRLYLLHLRFWNHIIQHEDINFIVMVDNPHHTHDFIIYALGKIKKISMCILPGCTIALRRFYCNDIEHIGKIMMDKYNNMSESNEYALVDDVENFYHRNRLENRKDISKDSNGISKKRHAKESKKHHFSDIDYSKQIKKITRNNLHGLRSSLKNSNFNYYNKIASESKEKWKYINRAHKLLNDMRTLTYYNKIATLPVENDKFILFLLQYQPEASTLPAAGVFVEQELAIQILAKSLENTGIKIYVKEHFVQPCRPHHFYDDLKSIRGVKLINSSIDSKELMKKSIATSTCTGTIILESIINSKPVLVFGHNGFEEGPGIFKVRSYEDCIRAIDIIKTFELDQKDVRRFLKAFSDSTFLTYQYVKNMEQCKEISIDESKRQIVETISNVIKNYSKIFEQ